MSSNATRKVPNLWYTGGTYPFCSASPTDCEQFGLDFVSTSKFGNSLTFCILGNKVLCRPKEIEPAEINSHPYELNIMTYNVYDFPYILKTIGQRERTCRIPREIYRSYGDMDIVMVQELFMEGCMEGLDFRALMKHYGWRYSTDTLASKSIVSGGVALFSKYPLNDIQFEVFSFTGLRLDALSPKGFVYANFEKDGRKFHVVSTHFQAWDGKKLDQIRLAQGRQISNFLDFRKITLDDVVIIGGDFNFDYLTQQSSVERLFTNMNMTMVPIGGSLETTFDPDLNNIVSVFEEPSWYDYIAVHKKFVQPVTFSMESIQLRSEEPFRVCMKPSFIPFWLSPDSSLCTFAQYTSDLSDHFPVIARFTFPPVVPAKPTS